MSSETEAGFSIIDFPLDTNGSNISEIHLTARYPQGGYVLNTKSEMVVYILTGKVILHQENTESFLDRGSVVLVKINTPYYWEPKEEVTLLIFSTPPWTSDQQKII